MWPRWVSPDKKIPLPWLLATAPGRLCGGAIEPILLKILDPLPEPVFGDLYFELHQQKQEVYVVTAVDQRAWPDGIGAIRFGFDSELRENYRDDQHFLADYFAAVRSYREVRVEIDKLLDAIRLRDGVGLNEPVSAATIARFGWKRFRGPCVKRRQRCAQRWSRFTRLLPLACRRCRQGALSAAAFVAARCAHRRVSDAGLRTPDPVVRTKSPDPVGLGYRRGGSAAAARSASRRCRFR